MQAGCPAAMPPVGCQLSLAVLDPIWLQDCMLTSFFELLSCYGQWDTLLLWLRCCRLVLGAAVLPSHYGSPAGEDCMLLLEA
jgi:hypothetical protein